MADKLLVQNDTTAASPTSSWQTLAGLGILTANQTITLTGAVTGSGTTAITTAFGTISTLNLIANTTGGTAAPAGVTLSSLLDVAISSAQATLIARSASAWASLPPGANGLPLRSFGSATNLAYSDTGLKITQHYGDIIVPAGTSGTITMDLSLGDWQVPAAVTGDFTLSASNQTVGQQFTVVLAQGSGSYAVTWFSGITWFGAPYTAPTMPNTSGAKLAATFKTTASGSHNGWWLGNTAV